MVSKKTSDSLGHALAVYFSEIENTQPLEPEEEVRLTKLLREGDKEALNKLINANLKFVVSVANKYRVTGIPLEDLINEGNIGLIKAAYRFDETRGFKFISYAVWWIRQSILQFISDKGRVVHLPANVANAVTKMKRRSEELEHSLERMPTMEELAEVMEITKQEAEKLVKFNTRSLSTDQPVGDDEKTSLRDLLKSEDSRPEAQIMKESLTEEIKRVLNTIPEREAMIIEYYFGIDIDRPLTLEEIGDQLRLTRERVRQLKEHAIKRLQHATRVHLLRAFLG